MAKKATSTNSDIQDLLRIWERSIQTQMHFAELSLKTRQIGLTVVGATLALAVVLHRSEHVPAIKILCVNAPVSALLCVGAGVVLIAMRLLDIGVYHNMLRGAVVFNQKIVEPQLKTQFGFDFGLTETITHFSRNRDAKATVVDGKVVYSESKLISAEVYLNWFYIIMISALLGLAVVLTFTA